MMKNYTYDIAISFAEEDRNIAVALQCAFKLKNISAYYYAEAFAQTLGYKLEERLVELYRKEAQYALIVLSQHYLKKRYCKVELNAIRQRVKDQEERYMVILTTDDTLPVNMGFSDDFVYRKWNYDPGSLAEIFWELLGKPVGDQIAKKEQARSIKNVFKNIKVKQEGGSISIIGTSNSINR